MIFTVSVGVFANGSQENPIRTARELIADNRINDAILLLEQTVRDNPDRIDEAESLLRAIREIRGEYNVLFEQLIDNLVNNPDNIERTLEIIQQMETLDEFPNERVVQQVEDARVIAQLAFDRNIFDTTMDEAAGYLAKGENNEAVRLYLELKDLQRSVFENRGYGDIFVNSVDQAIEQIEVDARDFIVQYTPYIQAGAIVMENLDQNTQWSTSLQTVMTDYAELTLQLALLQAGTATTGQDLTILRSRVGLQFPDDPVDWYLIFQDSATRGRTDNRDTEGIGYAMETTLQDVNQAVRQRMQAYNDAELTAVGEMVDKGQYEDAVSRYADIAAFQSVYERVLTAEYGVEETLISLDNGRYALPDEVYSRLLEIRSDRAIASTLEKLYGFVNQVATATENRERTLFSLESRRDALYAVYSAMEREFGIWESDANSLISVAGIPDNGVRKVSTTTSEWQNRLQNTLDLSAGLVKEIAELQREPSQAALDTQDSLVAELNPYLEGIDVEVGRTEEGEALTRLSRYPDYVIEQVNESEESFLEARRNFSVVYNDFTSVPDFVESSQIYQDELLYLEEFGGLLASVSSNTDQLIRSAQSLIEQSSEQRETGDARVRDARAAISSLLITTAKDNWEAARNAYFTSLELREDEEFRAYVDELILALGEEIQEAENIIVVRRVRELLNEAQALYDRDGYIESRDVLLEATQIWEQTNVDSNAEIDRLMRLVTAALNLEEGRELTITDPLYPILGNYLSLAKEDFNRARTLLESSDTEEADRLFDRCLQNLRNVRDVRPLNWEARVLELRIAQTRSDEDFEEIFKARYDQAVGRLGEATPVEVYAELEVLADINPDYPGIQDQMHQLEITLNLREDPVDQIRIAQAASLFQRAETLAQSGTRDESLVAISLLEEAITINPGSTDAQYLLDELRISLGGQAQVALSTSDEQQYRRAETLFSQGRVLQALQIVEGLLANEDNQNYPPLVDLRRRISIRLGI